MLLSQEREQATPSFLARSHTNMKTKKRSRGGAWDAADHAARAVHNKTERQAHRTAVLTRDTSEKRSAMRTKLHLTKIKRQVLKLKQRLMNWDDDKAASETAAQPPPRKKGRKGPETWQLRGAARPAWQVYDFDTRYVDPHQAQPPRRTRNLLAVENFDPATQPLCREYLGLLMRWGHLAAEARQYRTARQCWLECMELEGRNNDAPTTAREDLMRLYLQQLQRYEAAWRLGQDLQDDSSVWIRYSTAWVAVQLQKDDAEECMVRAIRSNPFCAYYLAFYETFDNVMEYTDDIENADDEPESSLEEALEYCASGIAETWYDNGAALVLRNLLVGVHTGGNNNPLSAKDVEWEERLNKIEEQFEARTKTQEKNTVASTGGESDHEDQPPDVKMFAGMFRTAMEMLEESGELQHPVSDTTTKTVSSDC